MGKKEEYALKAEELGQVLATSGIELIYGAGNVGLMGEIARSVLENKGRVIGIIPKKIYEKVEHIDLSGLHVVEGMHERKAKMYESAEGFIAMPGGIGTIEELSEVFTWQQLGYHCKPVGVLNISGFFDQFLSFADHMVNEGFLSSKHRDMLLVEEEPAKLVERLKNYRSEYCDKWNK